MKLKLLLIASLLASSQLLTSCAVTTPLVLAGAGGHTVARLEENIRVRGAAAITDEPDLLTFSMQAIADNKTESTVDVYLQGYNNPEYSNSIKSLALYQIALIYMNRFNNDRDYPKAKYYLNKQLKEFPKSRLKTKVKQHITLLDKRMNSTEQPIAKQLLKTVDRQKLLAKNHVPFDAELTPMSERAIMEERVQDAESVYLVLYNNTASSDTIRAKGIYQLGLIYMSPYNPKGNNGKAMMYFRKIINEFPRNPIAKKAQHRLNQVINRQ